MSGVIQVCITYDIPEHKVLTQASCGKLTFFVFFLHMICASHTFIRWVAMCTQGYLLFLVPSI